MADISKKYLDSTIINLMSLGNLAGILELLMKSDQPQHRIVKSCTYHPYKLTAAVEFLSKNFREMKPRNFS